MQKMWIRLLLCVMLSLVGVGSCSDTTLSGEFGQGTTCLVDSTECKAPTHEDLHHMAAIINSMVGIAAEIGAVDVSTHLHGIVSNLRSGKLRTGVIGFQNAGKSTFLNALLSKKFLPSSIQAQTAKEMIIVHDPASPDGVLYGVKRRDDIKTAEPLTTGRKSINDYIHQLNQQQRSGETSEEKESEKLTYVLNAPIRFLEDHADTRIKSLEISDTPGLGEAGCKGTEESKLAVKEMSAFVLILNVQFLKTQAELDILHALLKHHPEIFENLNRILIVVNAYDVAYMDTNPESLKPENISQYVSDYLSQKEFLGTTIPSERIIPFTAKWALKARQWHSDPDATLQDEDEMLSYKLALNLLETAGFKEQINYLGKVTKENVKAVSKILEIFSHIGDIEQKLIDMLLRNGPSTLLKLAAKEDTHAAITDVKTLIRGEIDSENILIKLQTQLFSAYEQIKAKFDGLKNKHISNIGQISTKVSSSAGSHIGSVTDSLRQTINGEFERKLNSQLSDFHKMKKNHQQVFEKIRSVRSLVESFARGVMDSSWNSLAASIRSFQLEHTKIAVSQFKIELVSSLQSIANSAGKFPELTAFISQTSSQISGAVDSIDTNVLVPGFGSMQISTSDGSLDQISKTMEERRDKRRKHGGGRGRGGKKWKKDHQNYLQVVVSALREVFSSQATSSWMQSFRSNIYQVTAAKSNQIIEAAKNALNAALVQPGQEIQRAVDASKVTLGASKERAKNLNDKFKKVESVENELK